MLARKLTTYSGKWPSAVNTIFRHVVSPSWEPMGTKESVDFATFVPGTSARFDPVQDFFCRFLRPISKLWARRQRQASLDSFVSSGSSSDHQIRKAVRGAVLIIGFQGVDLVDPACRRRESPLFLGRGCTAVQVWSVANRSSSAANVRPVALTWLHQNIMRKWNRPVLFWRGYHCRQR
jgi:hypothetical protein